MAFLLDVKASIETGPEGLLASIWLSNEKVSKRKPVVLYFCSRWLCANRTYMKRAFGRVSIRKEVKSFSNYRPAKLSVRDVCLLQTYVTHRVHFESPLFHLQTHFELLWAKKRRLSSSLWKEINQLVRITRPLLSFHRLTATTSPTGETYLMSIGGT